MLSMTVLPITLMAKVEKLEINVRKNYNRDSHQTSHQPPSR